MKAIKLELSQSAKIELEQIRDRHNKPYMRERAAALLLIAAGHSGRWVAFNGLLKPRRKHTIYDWVKTYKAKGIVGLYIQKGRGRKPSFFPSKSESGQIVG